MKHHPVENRYCNSCRITTRQFITSNDLPLVYCCMRCATRHTVTPPKVKPEVKEDDGAIC